MQACGHPAQRYLPHDPVSFPSVRVTGPKCTGTDTLRSTHAASTSDPELLFGHAELLEQEGEFHRRVADVAAEGAAARVAGARVVVEDHRQT